MARTEVWVEDTVAPSGRWVWIGGYEGDGGNVTVQASASGSSSTVGSMVGPVGSTQFLSLPGVAGSIATVPSSTDLNLSGVNTVRMRIRRPTWSAASNQVVLSKWGTSGNFSWFWRFQADGQAYFLSSTTGSNTVAAAIGPPPAAPADNTTIWVQLEVESNSQTVLSTHPDQEAEPTTGWTAISTSATGSTLGAIYASTTVMAIGDVGAAGGYQPIPADVFQLVLRDETDAKVFQLDPNNWTTGSTWVTSTGQTVTLTGTASIGNE